MLEWVKEPWGPAWLQAGGSILALIIAIWVPAWQHRQDQKIRAEESRKIASLRAKRFLSLLQVDMAQEHGRPTPNEADPTGWELFFPKELINSWEQLNCFSSEIVNAIIDIDNRRAALNKDIYHQYNRQNTTALKERHALIVEKTKKLIRMIEEETGVMSHEIDEPTTHVHFV